MSSDISYEKLKETLVFHGFYNLGLKYFKEEMVDFTDRLRQFYIEQGAYFLVDLLDKYETTLDKKYCGWFKHDELPLLFEIKEKYSFNSCF